MFAQISHHSVNSSRQDLVADIYTSSHHSVMLTFVGHNKSWCEKQAILTQIMVRALKQKG